MPSKRSERVRQLSPAEANARIKQQTEENIRLYGCAGPDLIERRLQELDQE